MDLFNEGSEFRLDFIESKEDKYVCTQYFETEEQAWKYIQEKKLYMHKLVKEIPISIRVDWKWANEET